MKRIKDIYFGWSEPKIDPSSEYEKDLRRRQVSAPRRLALFICRGLSETKKERDANIAKAQEDQIYESLLNFDYHETVKYTPAEAAFLYEDFLRYFDLSCHEQECEEENLRIHWSVDYHPDKVLADILAYSRNQIRIIREESKGPLLPNWWGVRTKSIYSVQNGCAEFNGKIIGHDGRLLEENPWGTFSKSGEEKDEVLAKQLQPIIPYKYKAQFLNRSIIDKMEFTFEKDAFSLVMSSNWGLVSELVHLYNGNLPLDEGFKVMKLVSPCYHESPRWDLIIALNSKGIPLLNPTSSYLADDPLFTFLQHKEIHCQYTKLKVPQFGEIRSSSLLQYFSWAARCFFKDSVYENRFSAEIIAIYIHFWTSLNLDMGEDLEDKEPEWKHTRKIELLDALRQEGVSYKDEKWAFRP